MNDLEKCVKKQMNVGIYQWLPDRIAGDITGSRDHQAALIKIFKKHKNNMIPVELIWKSQTIMEYYCDGMMIGFIPTDHLDRWNEFFNYMGDAPKRMVGTVQISYWDKGKMYLPGMPAMQVIYKPKK